MTGEAIPDWMLRRIEWATAEVNKLLPPGLVARYELDEERMRHEERPTNHRSVHEELRMDAEDDVPGEVYGPLSKVVNGHAIERWWRTPMHKLDGHTPETMWKTGHADRVRAIITDYLAPPSFT